MGRRASQVVEHRCSIQLWNENEVSEMTPPLPLCASSPSPATIPCTSLSTDATVADHYAASLKQFASKLLNSTRHHNLLLHALPPRIALRACNKLTAVSTAPALL
ncbi:hypothetical protein E2C01_046208 [Portunus trituberculatus]|uniref:Uncharacterized protein n=1 Tax=Portunus trituberculatus TaxID=210409 RepID=A0A5B7G512_PORTR|nr:hypothetical protein [Portunus trituberculatus]